ncbi:MAG: hypothetical protein WBP29_07180 [Candidatus Zixiibacteriota bacterium]
MFDSSINGIRSGLDMANRAAQNMARFETAEVSDQVDLMIAEVTVKANVIALRTSLEMSEHLIDLLA